MAQPVTIAIPCYKRGVMLEQCLKSIRGQDYGGNIDLLVVEDGRDGGLTEGVAFNFGARYFSIPRFDSYPEFQSVAKLWNHCILLSRTEALIMQSCDIVYKSPNLVADLVAKLESSLEVHASPLVEILDRAGVWGGDYYNHPTEGCRPGWVFGGAPHIFRKSQLLAMGGYDQRFYGYGHEDDYFFYLLGKNGLHHEYVTTATAAHLWHERPLFEPTTGYANRSLMRLFTTEVESDFRAPIANREPIVSLAPALPIDTLVAAGLGECFDEDYQRWAKDWLGGKRNVDDTFSFGRTIASGKSPYAQIGEMILESAWATLRQAECMVAQHRAIGKEQLAWAARCFQCGDIHRAWSARAQLRAGTLIQENIDASERA